MIKITEMSEQQINAALQALNNEIESLRSQLRMTDSKQVNSDWDATSGPAQILNKPHLASVATSGSYNDLKDKPSDSGGSFTQVNSDWAATRGVAVILNKPNLATVATTGDYNDLTNKPTIPEVTYSLNEHKIGKWVDDSDLYEKTIVLNIPDNGNYAVSTGVSDLKNLAHFTGIFYQGSMSNPQWCMHIPYTYIDTINGTFLNIYVYYDPTTKSFQCNFVGTYSPHYYNGEAYITFRYTKSNSRAKSLPELPKEIVIPAPGATTK